MDSPSTGPPALGVERPALFLSPRRFGLPLTPNSRPSSSPQSSPNTISLEEYEREGREETRKELAALFERLEKNPELTKHLPHVTQAMKENGKSSAQTARLRALRHPPKPSKSLLLPISLVFILIAALAGLAYSNLGKTFSTLPHAAAGSSEQLLTTLKMCTSELYGNQATETLGAPEFHPNCVNFRDSLTRQTPLHIASQTNRLQNIAILLQHGADIKLSDRLGSRPLHRAKSAAASAKLIEAGADVNALDSYNRTALFTCATSDQVMTISKGLPAPFLHQDMTNSTALLFSLRSCYTPHSSEFQEHIQRAHAIVSHMPISIAGSMATVTDMGGDSALKLIVDLASIPDPERRVVGARLLADAMLQISRSLVADPSQVDLISTVQNLEIPTKLVKRDALGAIAALLSASTHQQDDASTQNRASLPPSAASLASVFDKLFDLTRCNAITGLYPVSYVRSANVLHLLLNHGARLDLKNNKSETPIQHILQSLSIHHPSMPQQLQLVEALRDFVSSFDSYIHNVPQEVRAAIERKFVIVNAEPMEWTVSSLILGLELLSEPSHLSYQRLELLPQDEVSLPDELKSRKTAQIDIVVTDLPSEVPYTIQVEAYSASDNLEIQMFVGDSKISKTASSTWFGAQPRIRLPLVRPSSSGPSTSASILTSSLTSKDSTQPPHFRVLVSCNNFFSPCSYVLSVKTSSVSSMDPKDLLPFATSILDGDLHLFAIARIATILWLPVSSLPRSLPVWLRFIPFFLSLSGFRDAGPIFALYWAGYTTATHIIMRILGW